MQRKLELAQFTPLLGILILSIAYSEMSRHLMLEAADVLRTCADDDQVIHIHADDELFLPPSPCVERVLGCAPREPKLAQRGVKLGVPRSWGLP